MRESNAVHSPSTEAVNQLLARHSLTRSDLLAAGSEAEVYGLNAHQVLRVEKHGRGEGRALHKKTFYAQLDASQVPFAVPEIISYGVIDNVWWSIDRRIPGRSLMAVLPTLGGDARARALCAYVDVAAQVRQLSLGQPWYGEVLGARPLRTDNWSAFVLQCARACVVANERRLLGHVVHPERAINRLSERLMACSPSKPHLVHGDLYPANVMAQEDGTITGLIDFGRLTLMGDPMLDLAGAVLYLVGMDGISTDDRKNVERRARDHGLGDADLTFCRHYLAFRFLDTSREGLFRWCVANLAEDVSRED